MSVLDNLKSRLDINNDSDNYQYFDKKYIGLNNMQARLNVRGGTDQWTRMREDKLYSLKKALLSSYQSAIVQKYDVKKDSYVNSLISIITLLQDQQELSDSQKAILDTIEEDHSFLQSDRYSLTYISQLQNIVDDLVGSQPLFRCLINHDKLKVDYEDKIISIPFFEPPIGGVDPIETDFHNGTVFKWVHGNKQEWTPDTYWIVYMQYSQETAYFRAQIRKADEQVEIITIDSQGNENSVTYRGWMTGPNETTALWHTKKNVTWNDMNYTKLLYITKDEDTLAFFQRFDRIIINGQPWEVQAYNDSYSTSKGADGSSGIIRVALKETYTSTDEFVKESLNAAAQAKAEQDAYDAAHTDTRIDGPTVVKPYEVIKYTAKNFEDDGTVREWSLYGTSLAKIIRTSVDGLTITVEVQTGFSNKEGFFVNYGNSEDTMLHVTIGSL